MSLYLARDALEAMRTLAIVVTVLALLVWQWRAIKPWLLERLARFIERTVSRMLGNEVKIHSITCDVGGIVRLGCDNVTTSNVADSKFVLPHMLHLGKVLIVADLGSAFVSAIRNCGMPTELEIQELIVDKVQVHFEKPIGSKSNVQMLLDTLNGTRGGNPAGPIKKQNTVTPAKWKRQNTWLEPGGRGKELLHVLFACCRLMFSDLVEGVVCSRSPPAFDRDSSACPCAQLTAVRTCPHCLRMSCCLVCASAARASAALAVTGFFCAPTCNTCS